MSKKIHKAPGGPRTGDDFIDLAKNRGALTEPAKDGFTRIKTPRGSVHIAPGKNPLDPQTRTNLRRWFRLLGLMVVALLCLWPIVSRYFFAAMS